MSTKSAKYRPYFTLAELSLLLSDIDSKVLLMSHPHENITNAADIQHWKNIQRTLRRTIAMINLDMQKPAYVSNPRATMNERLGFSQVSEDTNFDELMEQLLPASAPISNPNEP